MTLSEIIEGLEKAERGDRELDASIAVNIVGMSKANRLAEYPDCQPLWGFTDGSTEGSAEVMVPRYTSSVDAALALAEKVLPGWEDCHGRLIWTHGLNGERIWTADIRYWRSSANHPIAAIAFCLAILKAKQMGVGE